MIHAHKGEGMLHNPPSKDKVEIKDELLKVKRAMELATQDQIDFAVLVDQAPLTPFMDFLDNHNITLMEDQLRDIDTLINRVLEVVLPLQRDFKVLRPAKLANRFKIDLPNTHELSKTGTGYSYPSGHSALAYIIALYLNDQLSDELSLKEQELIMEIAMDISLSRMMLGVHCMRDLKEGARIASIIYQQQDN